MAGLDGKLTNCPQILAKKRSCRTQHQTLRTGDRTDAAVVEPVDHGTVAP